MKCLILNIVYLCISEQQCCVYCLWNICKWYSMGELSRLLVIES